MTTDNLSSKDFDGAMSYIKLLAKQKTFNCQSRL